MENYETRIMDFLQGETPKEKYEYLRKIFSDNNKLKGTLEYVDLSLTGVMLSEDDAKLKGFKYYIQLIKEQMNKHK